MFITDTLPALNIPWLEIGTIVSVIFTILLIVWNNNKRFDKKADKIDMEKQLEKICADNSSSHAKLEEKTDRYFELVRDEMRIDRENLAQIVKLLRDAVRESGNTRKTG